MDAANLAKAAKQLESKLDIKDNVYKGTTYKRCFTGTECVKVIIDLKLANNEGEAVNFGINLMREGYIRHVQKLHAFKNQDLLYEFPPIHERQQSSFVGPAARSQTLRNSSQFSHHRVQVSGSGRDVHRNNRSTPRGKTRTSFAGGGLQQLYQHSTTFSSVGDLMQRTQQDSLRRREVYFRVNRYLRLNRLKEASAFLRELLKYVANKHTLDWSVVQGPTLDGSDINKVTDASKEKWLQDIMGESQACWMDVNLLECKLKLFYETHNAQTGGDDHAQTSKEVIGKLQSILSALKKSVDRAPSLEKQSYYYLFVACEARAYLAYAIVKSSSIGYAAYAGLALGHCRKAMKLNPFHSLSHAVYGYLLDRCLDKYEEARQYLEYAIHLNNYYDSVNAPEVVDETVESETTRSPGGSGRGRHQSDYSTNSTSEALDKRRKDFSYHRFAYIHVWLATLLVNFEDEFREIEFEIEQQLRSEFKRKYKKALEKKRKEQGGGGGGAQTKGDDDGDGDGDDEDREDSEEIMTSPSADSADEDDNGGGAGAAKKPPTAMLVNMGSSSIQLVRQLTEANALHRQRNSIIASAIHGAGTSLGYNYSVTGDTPLVDATEKEEESKSRDRVSITESDMQTDKPPLYGAMTVQIETEMAEKLAEQMADDTLTKKIGNRFGSDFESQMTNIPDKPDGHFSLALQLEPQNSRFHSIYGVFLIHQEKLDDAKPHFEKAIKYDPEDVVSLNNLGWILSLSRFSQFQEAKSYLTKAAKLRPKSAAIHFNLARLLAHAFGKNEQQNARRHYQAALMYDKQNPHILYFYACFQRFMLRNKEAGIKALKEIDKINADEGRQTHKDSTFEVNGYIEHAKILQHEERFNAAKFLLKKAGKLDISRKREIMEMLKEIAQEEKELNILRQHHSIRGGH